MKIKSILNNSALISTDEKGEEVILVGKGISFQKHPGDTVDDSKVEKTFKRHSSGGAELLDLLDSIPEKYFEVTNLIVRYANKKLRNGLDKNIYITLFDHINSAIERYEEGIQLEFGLLDEIKILYPEIYTVSVWTLDYLNASFDIELNDDEAGFLSIHFLNALRDSSKLQNAKKVMSIVHDMVGVIEENYPHLLKRDGMDYARAVTHLKYLAVRYLNHDMFEDDPIQISGLPERPEIPACAALLNQMLKEKYGKALTENEISYLTLHLYRCMAEQE